jgi:hypothetical protein
MDLSVSRGSLVTEDGFRTYAWSFDPLAADRDQSCKRGIRDPYAHEAHGQ